MLPVLAEAPYQFWALLAAILAAFLASRLPNGARADPTERASAGGAAGPAST